MKKKNLFMVLFVLATAMFYSCGSDDSSNNNGNNDDNPTTDDNTPGVPHIMEGTWGAETISWEVGGNEQTLPFSQLSGQCNTDIINIVAQGVAKLTENKLNEGVCEDVITNGTWTPETVNFSESSREVISVNDTTLKLKYHEPSIALDITVTYSRQ